MKKQCAVLLLACWAGWTALASAQEAWPSKPIKVLVGVAPGGATDIQARLFSQKLSKNLGQPFVVENRPGAGEVVAIQAVIRATPDGYTVLAITPGLTIGPAFRDKPGYDPLKDLMPVSMVTRAPYLLVVPASSPFKTLKDLLAFAKSAPGALNFGTAGLGSPPHLGAAWLGSRLGSPVTLINYKGTGPVLTALLAGEIHATFANPVSALVLVKAGKLRALAVTSAERSRVFPDLPTLAEAGLAGFDVTTWHGWLVPRGTPASIVTRLHDALSVMVHSKDVSDGLEAEGAEPIGNSPEQFSQMISAELVRWRRVIKEADIKLE